MAFFSRATPEEMLRKNQRALTRAMRELDRERSKLEQQEKKLILDIKKMAKAGQMDAVKIMARDLVRTRSYIKKFITMRANIQAISLKVQTLKSQASMANAMKGVTQAMKRMNNKMNLPQIQKIMMEFEKQSEIMDMKEEVMNDAIDEVIGDADDDEESDLIVAQVFDELGLELTEELAEVVAGQGEAGKGKIMKTATTANGGPGAGSGGAGGGGGGGATGGTTGAAGPSDDIDADLQARLDNLRKGDN